MDSRLAFPTRTGSLASHQRQSRTHPLLQSLWAGQAVLIELFAHSRIHHPLTLAFFAVSVSLDRIVGRAKQLLCVCDLDVLARSDNHQVAHMYRCHHLSLQTLRQYAAARACAPVRAAHAWTSARHEKASLHP